MKYSSVKQLEKIILENLKLIEKYQLVKLTGQLGAGKTTFVKIYGKIKGIKKTINSPTYQILKEYSINNYHLIHVDAYRIENEDIGLNDFTNPNTQIFVEWAEKIENFIPVQSYLDINIKINVEQQTREIHFKEYNV